MDELTALSTLFLNWSAIAISADKLNSWQEVIHVFLALRKVNVDSQHSSLLAGSATAF